MELATPAEILAAIDTAILSIVTGEIESTTVGGRVYSLLNLVDLQTLRDKYAGIVASTSSRRQRIVLVDMRGAT